MAEKPSDRWAVSLCRSCHTRQHRIGELQFWEAHGLNPFQICIDYYTRFCAEHPEVKTVKRAKKRKAKVKRVTRWPKRKMQSRRLS
jgi:hypothetical protein